MDAIDINLPEPDTSKIETLTEAMENKRTLVEYCVDEYINESGIGDLVNGDELPNALAGVREELISTIMRDWMREQNILPMLDDIFSTEGTSFTDRVKAHHDTITKSLKPIISNLIRKEASFDKKVGKVRDKVDNGQVDENGNDIPATPPPAEPGSEESGIDDDDDALNPGAGGSSDTPLPASSEEDEFGLDS